MPFSSCKLCQEAVWSSGSVVGSTSASFHARVPFSALIKNKRNDGWCVPINPSTWGAEAKKMVVF